MHSPSSLSSSLLSPTSCENYFKLGSKTRRYSVIGCIGYECANPCVSVTDSVGSIDSVGSVGSIEKVDVGVGCDESNGETTCAICLESLCSGIDRALQKNVATTDCGHTFCLSCLLKNLHTSNLCPLCRTPVEKDVKHVLKPLSYMDGIGLLDHELNGLQILEEVEQFVQNAMEISSQPNTDGQNVEDVIGNLMNMVTNFGFNLLYDATLHTTGSEQHMDRDWIIQLYGESSDNSGSDSDSGSDSGSDSDSDSGSNCDSDSSHDDDDDAHDDKSDTDDSHHSDKKVRVILPEVPESMLN